MPLSPGYDGRCSSSFPQNKQGRARPCTRPRFGRARPDSGNRVKEPHARVILRQAVKLLLRLVEQLLNVLEFG